MVQGLLCIVVIYAAGAVAVQLAWRFCGRRLSGEKHYILHTLNDQRHVEWAVRSLTLFGWLSGRPVSITIVDEGSTDDTLAIVRCLSRRHELNIRSAAEADAAEIATVCAKDAKASCAETIRIRLYRPEELAKLPLIVR